MDLIINVWYFVSGFWTYCGPQTALGGHSGPLDQNHSFCNDRWFLIMRKLARDGSSNLEQSLTRLTRTSETKGIDKLRSFYGHFSTTAHPYTSGTHPTLCLLFLSLFNDRTPLHFRYTWSVPVQERGMRWIKVYIWLTLFIFNKIISC